MSALVIVSNSTQPQSRVMVDLRNQPGFSPTLSPREGGGGPCAWEVPVSRTALTQDGTQ